MHSRNDNQAVATNVKKSGGEDMLKRSAIGD